MKQAKTLTHAELKRVLAVAGTERHAERNKLALLLSYYAGLRVKEIAALTIGDVDTAAGDVKSFVALTAEQTKGHQGRNIVFNAKLKDALQSYMRYAKLKQEDATKPLLRSQKGAAFSANSLCQLFARLYAAAGIEGASSHSGRRTFITNLAHKGVSAKVLMTLFKGAKFSKEAAKREIADKELCEAIAQVIASPKTYSLGGEVYKKRLNDNLDRSIIVAKGGKNWFYVHLFRKSDQDNISKDELAVLRELAKAYARVTGPLLEQAIKAGELEEICYGCDEKK